MKQSEIKKLVKKLNIQPSAEMYDRTLSDTLDAQQIQKKKTAANRPNLWRLIMESKLTKYSAAAVVTLAAALVLTGPFGTSKNGSILLADVVDKVHQMNTVIHKEKRIVREIGKEEPSGVADVVKYLSEEHGYAEHSFDENGALMFRAYFLKETQQFIIVFPAEKKYMRLSLPEEIFNRLTMILTPIGLVDYCTSLKYTELGRAEFDNVDVEGFETTDPNVFPIPEPLRLVFPARDLVARLWIDVETSLPVGIESEFNTDSGLLTGFKRLHGEFKAYDLQWNAELPEGVFDPNIPDDYTELKVTDFIPTEAKAGLVGLGIIPVGLIVWRRQRKKVVLRRI